MGHERDIERIEKEEGLSRPLATFIWKKTEHSVPAINLCVPKEGMKILEVGAGKAGFTLAYLWCYPEINFKMTILDFSNESLDIARKRIEKAGFADRVKIVRGDMLALPFKENSFDMILCPSVIEHLVEQDLALVEMSRVLKHKGTIMISTDAKFKL